MRIPAHVSPLGQSHLQHKWHACQKWRAKRICWAHQCAWYSTKISSENENHCKLRTARKHPFFTAAVYAELTIFIFINNFSCTITEICDFCRYTQCKVYTKYTSLDAFAYSRKASISFIMSLRPPVRLWNLSAPIPLDGFLLNLVPQKSTKICR
jgi:hypothetical protein